MTASAAPMEVHHGGMRLLRWRGPGIPGAPLVFLHGLGDGADIWDPVLRAMPGGPMASVALDLPGHGGSDWLRPRDYRVSVLTDVVAAAMGRELIRRPVLIGHSLGARVTLELVARGMVAAERVILIDMNPDPVESVGTAVSDHLDLLAAGAPDSATFVSSIARRMPLADRAILDQTIPALARARRAGDTEMTPGIRMPFDPEISRLLDAPNETDGWANLAALNCPVTIIRGGFSSALDANKAREMAERCRHPASVLTIPAAGHAIALEQPAGLAKALFKAINGKIAAAI